MTGRGIRTTSIRRMVRAIEAAAAGCAWKNTAQVEYTQCVSYLAAKRRDGWGGSTYDQNVSVLRCFGQYLRRARIATTNPLEDLMPSRDGGGEGARAYSVDEAALHVAASLRRHQTDGRAIGNAPLFWTFCFMTGMRHHEASACTWGDVACDCARPMIITSKEWSKSRRRDRIALAPEIARLMTIHRGQVPSARRDRVWPIVPTRATWHADREAAGIPEIDERGRPATVHTCRKSFATWLDDLPGVSAGIVARLTRHARSLTEERYIDPAVDREREAVSGLKSPWPSGAIPHFRNRPV